MAINPINLNPLQPVVPQADYSWLSNLVPNIQQSRANSMKIAAGEREQGALAELGKLNPNDPNYMQQVAQLALRAGNFGAGASILNNAAELKLKQENAALLKSQQAAINGIMGSPSPAAPAVAPQAPAQPPITTNLPLFGRPQSLQETTPPGGTVAPAIPARTSEASSPAAQANPVVFAKTQLGRGEIPDRAALQDYMRTGGANLDPATLAWCAAFVNASLGHAGIKGTGSNMARSFLNFGSPTQNPNPGDIAVFQRGGPNAATGHVGFYQGRDANGNILVLGGNQGNRVSVAAYPESHLLGFRKVMPGDSGTAGPVGPTSPGTVLASLAGRGPTGAGRSSVQTAALDPANFNIGNPAVASDISPTPMARTAVVGNQAAGGPANITNPGGEQQAALLPNPTPLQATPLPLPNAAPPMSLAALGGAPAGTIAAPPAGPPTASDASSVQMAQAGPHQLPWNFTQPATTPTLPARPPVQQPAVQSGQQAPAQPQRTPQAGYTDEAIRQTGSFPHLRDEQITRLVPQLTHPQMAGTREMLIKEMDRRNTLKGQRLMTPLQEQQLAREKQQYELTQQTAPFEILTKALAARGDDYDKAKAEYAERTKGVNAPAFMAREDYERIRSGTPEDKGRMALGENAAKVQAEISKEWRNAAGAQQTVQLLKDIVQSPGFYSGFAGPLNPTVQRIKDAFGLQNNAQIYEVFGQQVDKLTLAALGGSLGSGVATADLSFIRGMNSGLGNSRKGNEWQVKIADRLLERQMAIGDMMAKNAERNKGLLNEIEFNRELMAMGKTPMFTPKEIEEMTAVANGPPDPNAPTRARTPAELRSESEKERADYNARLEAAREKFRQGTR